MYIGTQITIGRRLQGLKLAEVVIQVLTYNYGCRPTDSHKYRTTVIKLTRFITEHRIN